MKLAVLAMVLSSMVATPARGQAVKIGYVDLQRALNESEAGKRAKDKFKTEVEKYQSDLKEQKEELEALREQIEKKGPVMKDDDRRELELKYQRKLRDFERAYKDSQGELQLKDSELTADILREINLVIQDFGKREGYTLILENSSSTVLYSAEDADLTDRIIQEYNKTKK